MNQTQAESGVDIAAEREMRGDKIRFWLEQSGHRHDWLAKKVGRSKGWMSLVLSGAINIPDDKKIELEQIIGFEL